MRKFLTKLKKLSPLRSVLLGAAILLPIGAIAAQLFQSEPEAVEPPDLKAYLEEKAVVVPDEQTLISNGACPGYYYDAFTELKEQGMVLRAEKKYAAAAAKFEEAFGLCRAPEVKIALNNAAIGKQLAYVLVVSVPTGGNNPNSANNAVEMLRGAAQAQEKINSDPELWPGPDADKRPLKLLLVDDRDQPEVAEQLAEILTDDDAYESVLGVVGHWTSDVSLAAAKVYNRSRSLVFMTPISTANNVTRRGSWAFRSTLHNSSGACALARYMLRSRRLDKAAVFYVDGVTYSTEIREEFEYVIDQQGGEIVAAFDMSDPNFRARAKVREVKRKGAEAILLATDNASVDKAWSVMREAEQAGGLTVLGDLANLYTPRTFEQAGDAAIGMVMATAWDFDGSADLTFKEDAIALWKGEVSAATATTYSAVIAMAEAMQGGATRLAIQSRLSDDDFASLNGAFQGPLTFEDRNLEAPVQLVQVVKLRGADEGTGTMDFTPILSESSCK